MNYRQRVVMMQRLQILLVAACIVGLLAYAVYVLQPKTETMLYPDECLLIGGTVSHSVPSEDACTNACRSMCVSKDMTYSTMRFQLREGSVCNLCECFCRK